MLDDYNSLDQFKIPLCFGYYKKLFGRIGKRALAPTSKSKQRLILLTDHQYLPFVWFSQILQHLEVDCLLMTSLPSCDDEVLVVSSFEAEGAIFIEAKSDQPLFAKDLEVILKLAKITDQYQMTEGLFAKLRANLKPLTSAKEWSIDSLLIENLPKQVALFGLGKSNLIITSNQFASVGLAFRRYFCLNAKNVAFAETIEDMVNFSSLGWLAQPIDKQFAVFDLVSKLDSKQARQDFVIKNRLLSGKMPASKIYFLKGQDYLDQACYGLILAQISSFYLAVLNKVRPDRADLLDKISDYRSKQAS